MIASVSLGFEGGVWRLIVFTDILFTLLRKHTFKEILTDTSKVVPIEFYLFIYSRNLR